MSSLVSALLLSLVSAVAYAAGAIVQERVAAAVPARPYAPLQHAGWWCAVLLNGVGAVLHVVALAYGPLSVVQPLGALTIVFALPMAALFVGRRAGSTAWRGALMATVGLAGLLAVSGDTGSHTLGNGPRGVLTAVTLGAVALLFLVAQTVARPVLRSVLLATAAGTAFGIASVVTKTVAVDWEWSRPVAQWTSLVVIAVLAVAGLLLSQASYRGAGLAAPLATVTVSNPVVSAVVGITMFGESFRFGVLGAVVAVAFGAVTAYGLVLLTRERLEASEEEAREEDGHEEDGSPAGIRVPAPAGGSVPGAGGAPGADGIPGVPATQGVLVRESVSGPGPGPGPGAAAPARPADAVPAPSAPALPGPAPWHRPGARHTAGTVRPERVFRLVIGSTAATSLAALPGLPVLLPAPAAPVQSETPPARR
ncbi:DMT family transporter [Streptomyces yaizuensis]|uniref:Integral membrane protein n=1 Tax=Streptomyces yaizuensis TaxID=2989713 RepID=A0ABQ5NRU7_9ACTN|nr:DMT family transporter [Streptomyces sp. YSPA8]GLF92766.1 hypothetical protein SYYSPA8_00735 [Streptomyces sp. YSPA8]